jgi:membrane protein
VAETAKDTVKQTISDAKGRWAQLQERRPSVRHLVEAWELLTANRGNLYAAAITYFSFLALFPLVLLGVAVLGFVLHSQPDTLQRLLDGIGRRVPGEFGNTLKTAVRQAIDARAGVGVLGLLGVLLTGLGWIANLRSAINAVWGQPPAKKNFLLARALNLLVLAGLGLGIALSLGLTTVGVALTDQILGWLNLDGVPGATLLLKVIGIALAVAGDMVIFWWVLVRLPAVHVPRRVEIKGALLAAVGFEVLKIIGTYTIAHTAQSPTAGPFAGILAVLIWIQLVARYMLFACAWTAVLTDEECRPAPTAAVPVVEPGPMPAKPPPVQTITPAAVGITLVGAGAVAGAVATWAVTRPRRSTTIG